MNIRCHCPLCGKDRGLQAKNRAARLCKSCSGKASHANISEETRAKMRAAKRGKAPWNKGIKGVSEETRAKMRAAKKNYTPCNKGVNMTEEQRIKLSCSIREIKESEFKGFTTPISRKLRAVFAEQGLHKQCFERDNYSCRACNIEGTTLNAHHIRSWKSAPELRYVLDNLICLCRPCHKELHSKYGINPTEENLTEFINSHIKPSFDGV